MAAQVRVGNCGWGYLIEEHFTREFTRAFDTKLEAYAELFNLVEINSTYYGIPRTTTAAKWRREADSFNGRFEFTLKAYQGITHSNRFSPKAEPYFARLAEVAREVKGGIVLFQSPSNFHPTEQNISKMRGFFGSVEREGLTFVWEPRGKWYDDPALIRRVCEEFRLIHCVDPFRNEPLVFGGEKMAYFRLHGFGLKSMYHYDFSDEELRWLLSYVREISPNLESVYLLFNNMRCYENARTFMAMAGVHPGS